MLSFPKKWPAALSVRNTDLFVGVSVVKIEVELFKESGPCRLPLDRVVRRALPHLGQESNLHWRQRNRGRGFRRRRFLTRFSRTDEIAGAISRELRNHPAVLDRAKAGRRRNRGPH